MTIGEKIGPVRKKIDDYLKSHKIETEFTPAVSLFGVVQFSLGEIKIVPDPDTWTKIDEAKIEEIVEKTVGISLQEYRELLRSEISTKDISEIKFQVEEIEEYIRSHTEYPFLSPDEFERVQENKFLLKYKKFIGRNGELQKLLDFLNGEDKIGLIVGRGGVGKTKLALEFAKQVKATGEWDVYFVNRYADFHPITLNDKTLLILDEALRYKDKDKIVDFVLNRSVGDGVKLLMIHRPISLGSIISDLKRKNVHMDLIELGKGDIALFLRENFEEIDEDKIRDIDEKCEGSFVYASLLAEYLRDKGEVGNLKEVLAQRIETYIEDLKDKIGKEQDVIKNAICQMAMVAPIDWFNKDREYLEKAFGFRSEYELVDEILNIAYKFPTEFLFYSSRNPRGFLIKPDQVADYLKSEFIKNALCEGWIRQLIPYMPLRLSLNIITISESNDISKDEILGDIWLQLNSSGGKTPEYFSALVLFAKKFNNRSYFGIDTLNVKTWIECYRRICKINLDDEEVVEQLSIALYYAARNYGKANGIDEMEGCIDELRRLNSRYPEYKGILKSLARGLVDTNHIYGERGNIDKMEDCLFELRRLVDSHPEERGLLDKFLSFGLANAVAYYGSSYNIAKMESCIDELHRFSSSYPQDKAIHENLARGLFNAVYNYGTALIMKCSPNALHHLRTCYRDINKRQLFEFLTRELCDPTNHYVIQGNIDDVASCICVISFSRTSYTEENWILESSANKLLDATDDCEIQRDVDKIGDCLDELRNLNTSYPDEYGILEWLASGLLNATNYYGISGDVDKMARCLNELRDLHSLHPNENDVLRCFASGLRNAARHYADNGDIDKMEDCLDELRLVQSSHPEDDEVLKLLAIGLVNATAIYLIVNDIDKMEGCLDELRRFQASHPEEKVVRKQLATGLVNATSYYGGFPDDVEKMYGNVVDIKNNDVRKQLATGLVNATNYYEFPVNVAKMYGTGVDRVRMEGCLEELRHLNSNHPEDNEVLFSYVNSLVNATNFYGIPGDVDKMASCLDELHRFYTSHLEEKAVRYGFASGLVNATFLYGAANYIDKMEGCIQELRSLYVAHSEDNEVRESLAKGLFNAAKHYEVADDIDKMEGCIQELMSLYVSHLEDNGVRESFAKGLFNAANYYRTLVDINKMEGCIEQLRGLKAAHPEDEVVRENLASGLFNAAKHYGLAADIDKMEGCMHELRGLQADHPDDKYVREELAGSFANALIDYGNTGNIDKMIDCIEQLRGLSASHPEHEEVRKWLVVGLANLVNHYGTAGDKEKLQSYLDELERLHSFYPEDPEVRKQLAVGLYNASNDYRAASDVDKMDRCLEELRRLAAANPDDSEVRKLLVAGLLYTSYHYSTADSANKMEGHLEELVALCTFYPEDKEVREKLASGLCNAVYYYVTKGCIDKMERCLKVLRRLNSSHPEDNEVRKQFAMALNNATGMRLIDGTVEYEDILLLHKLRFDLAENVTIINQIELLLINMTKNMIKDRCAKGDFDLVRFIDKLKSEIDDAEFILLRASEDLPLTTQKKILELI